MAQRSVPAPFLTKTYQIVEDRGTDDVISWNENGSAFVVWKSAEFARDLLPTYFKHNNFSSFVRQLNTYGFRKIVPGRWEFMHESFKKGEIELLRDIHRRKSTHALTLQAAPAGNPSSQSNSGDDRRSGSTNSPDPKNNGSDDTTGTTNTQHSNLSGENEKLRRDNELLNSELARTKKQCEDLVAFLAKQVNIGPDQISQIMMQGSDGATQDEASEVQNVAVDDNDNDEKENEKEQEKEDTGKKPLKLFGVWLKGEKREGDETNVTKPSPKKMKMAMDYDAPWMKMSSSSGESSKVCN
ncbi:hypothetical protein ACHQM5_023988 [Ranunculus cassubicifolius]